MDTTYSSWYTLVYYLVNLKQAKCLGKSLMLLIDIDAVKQVCTIGVFKYKGENMLIILPALALVQKNIYNYEMKLL